MFNNLILSCMVVSTIATSNPDYSRVNNVEGVTNNNKNIEAKKDIKDNNNYIYVADVPLYKGKISKITETNDGIDLLVNNISKDTSTYESLIFHVIKDTTLNIQKQELKVGDTVDVFYSGAVTRSLPGQATAIAVNRVQETFSYEGEITNITETKFGKMVSVVSKNKNAEFEEIIFTISNDTKFYKGIMSDLKVGAKINTTYGPVMTMSLPPRTSALSIEFLK